MKEIIIDGFGERAASWLGCLPCRACYPVRLCSFQYILALLRKRDSRPRRDNERARYRGGGRGALQFFDPLCCRLCLGCLTLLELRTPFAGCLSSFASSAMASIDKITAPYMKKQQTWIDKRGLKRQVPMKVLCLGLSRTGTSSMRVALWSLGYEAYHGWSLFENPPDGTLWQEAMAAKFKGEGNVWGRKEFDSIFYDSDACLDVPSNNFARELIEAYPDAKVVMTTRDVDSWHQCVIYLLSNFHLSKQMSVLTFEPTRIDPAWTPSSPQVQPSLPN